ncbi:hypothetical protein EVAR_84570_1 [Eumeta japonica]|uniref:Uncharacterized protein n=1 Tax=Eumeta variegata TaxID=151549 RepID=A0A4C1UIM4_EUMVA|nr:hypothetical protein EVAR_84570_1 [Eumeta japonica]
MTEFIVLLREYILPQSCYIKSTGSVPEASGGHAGQCGLGVGDSGSIPTLALKACNIRRDWDDGEKVGSLTGRSATTKYATTRPYSVKPSISDFVIASITMVVNNSSPHRIGNYSVLSRFDGPGCGSASDRVSELNTSGRTGEGRDVNVGGSSSKSFSFINSESSIMLLQVSPEQHV